MNDRELLELAAKAAGLKPSESDGVIYAGFGSREWNPLADDGDALRLAVGLRIDIVHFIGHVRADMSGMPDTHQMNNGDPYAAARRAIVRAAAEIGKVAK